jgi:YggT family protein
MAGVATKPGVEGAIVFFVGQVIDWILWIFLLILFARMILSWVPVLVRDWEPRGPMLVFAEIIYSITDPPLRLLRRVLKPVRVGSMMLDLAFIGLAIGVSILMQINRTIFMH